MSGGVLKSQSVPVRFLFAAVLFACLLFVSQVQASAVVNQYEVDDWSDPQFCHMRMVLTNGGSPYYPVTIYDSAAINVGLYDLSFDMAALGLGCTQQEILGAFTAVIEQAPLGELAHGWSVPGTNEYGELLLVHDPVNYNLWTDEAASNNIVLTLSIDKKYLGPNATLVLNQNHFYFPGFSAFDQYGYLHANQTNVYQLQVLEPATLLLFMIGTALTLVGRTRHKSLCV